MIVLVKSLILFLVSLEQFFRIWIREFWPHQNRDDISPVAGQIGLGFWRCGVSQVDYLDDLLTKSSHESRWEKRMGGLKWGCLFSIFICYNETSSNNWSAFINVGERLPSNMGRTKIHWRSLWHQQPKAVRFVDLLQKELDIGWHRAIGRTGWHLEVKVDGWFSHELGDGYHMLSLWSALYWWIWWLWVVNVKPLSPYFWISFMVLGWPSSLGRPGISSQKCLKITPWKIPSACRNSHSNYYHIYI